MSVIMQLLDLVIVLLCLSVAACEYTEEDDVIILTNENFESAITEFKFLLVEFYAPWCGHCKTLAPAYAKAAQTLKAENSTIRLAKVDATEHKQVAEKYDVTGYPTLKFFREGSSINVGILRHASEIVSFLKKKTGPPAQTLTTVQSAKDLIANEYIVVIGFFKDLNTAGATAFLDVAFETEDIPFAITGNDELYAEFGVKKNTVIVFKKFDEPRVDLTEDMQGSTIREFVQSYRLPLVNEFTQENAAKLFSGQKKHVLLFVGKDSEKFNDLLADFKDAAVSLLGKALFIYVDCDTTDHRRVLEYFNLKSKNCPTIRYINLVSGLKYESPTGDLSAKGIGEFVREVQAGKVKPHYMSDELPADWDSKPVKVLVGKNFDQVAKDKSKTVFVEFYAPWCGHCKELEPVWDELGEKYKDHSDIVIAKLDSTANEVADTKILSFPTLKLYPKDSDEVMEFEGNKTLEHFVEFLESGGKLHKREPVQKEIKKDEL